jgi:hypothetical protein
MQAKRGNGIGTRTFHHGDLTELAQTKKAAERDHLRAVAQRVEVVSPSEIRVLGAKTELPRTLAAAASVESAVVGVRSLYRNGAPEEIRTPDPQIRSMNSELFDRTRRHVAILSPSQ